MFTYLAKLALSAAFVWPSCLASGLCIRSCTLSQTESAYSGRCCAIRNSTAAPSHPHKHNCPHQCGVFAILDSKNRQVILLDALKRPCFPALRHSVPSMQCPPHSSHVVFTNLCAMSCPIVHCISRRSVLLRHVSCVQIQTTVRLQACKHPHPGCRYCPPVFWWLFISAQFSFIRISSFSAGTSAAQQIASVVSSVGTLVLWCSL